MTTAMSDPVVVSTDSPERGWPPMIDWLREHCGADWADVVSLTAEPTGEPRGGANVELAMRAFDRHGQIAVDNTTGDHVAATYRRTGWAASMPPLNR